MKKFALCYGSGMSLWNRTELTALIADWKAAYKAASTGRSYTIQGRTLTRYDLAEIREQLSWLQHELDALDSGLGSSFIAHARTRR